MFLLGQSMWLRKPVKQMNQPNKQRRSLSKSSMVPSIPCPPSTLSKVPYSLFGIGFVFVGGDGNKIF